MKKIQDKMNKNELCTLSLFIFIAKRGCTYFTYLGSRAPDPNMNFQGIMTKLIYLWLFSIWHKTDENLHLYHVYRYTEYRGIIQSNLVFSVPRPLEVKLSAF